MMTCKDVSTLISTGQLAEAPLLRRISVRVHLAMCRPCRAFLRQIQAVARSARSAATVVEAEPSAEFESRMTERLRRRGGSPPT